ncbi:60S ribosomal protein L18a-2 [Abeliophyllum distichum]|uniref:60S ribosomal protein L18a-2 n=1 Tax=Abeliophyllum distichum TaxID=126358 RepID=A0ABD1QFQ0_9LAMI
MVTYKFHQYQVVGRALPTETDEHPKIYRMKLWATNEVRAKSKFWYFLRKLKKVKKSNGQMLAINEIFEKNPTTIKNYGIWLRYQSRTGYHNMYKEYRDTTLNGAVEQMYTEMASRHRVHHHCIQIIKTATIPAKLCKRESTKQFHNSKIKFPLVFRKIHEVIQGNDECEELGTAIKDALHDYEKIFPLSNSSTAVLLFLVHFAQCSSDEHKKSGSLHNSSKHVNSQKTLDITLHGILLWASMGFLMPIGVLTIRMSSTEECHRMRRKILFYVHAILQVDHHCRILFCNQQIINLFGEIKDNQKKNEN